MIEIRLYRVDMAKPCRAYVYKCGLSKIKLFVCMYYPVCFMPCIMSCLYYVCTLTDYSLSTGSAESDLL